MKSENFLTSDAQRPRLEELLRVVLQVQDDVGAAGRLLDRLDGELALAVGLPPHAVGRRAGRARDDRDLVGDHERGVEADAELADQVGPRACTSCCCSASRNARVPDWAMVPRFSTIVSRDMPMPLSETVSVPAALSGDELDLPVLVAFELVLVGERVELDLVDGVGGVADQFAEEDLAVGVERVGDEVEELLQFGLELHLFRGHGVLRIDWPQRADQQGQARSASTDLDWLTVVPSC